MMLRKFIPLVLWLVMGAIILPLFQQIGQEHRVPFTTVEDGIGLATHHDTSSNLLTLKLVKKFNGTALFTQNILTGKSLCRPAAKRSIYGAVTGNRPLFLLHHAFLFYDFAT